MSDPRSRDSKRSAASAIYYFVPEYDQPSWGVGLLCHHVRLLRDMGFDAFVLQRKRRFRLSWLSVENPTRSVGAGGPKPSDIVVIPEVLAHDPRMNSIPGRRVVFIQGSFLIQVGLDRAIDYKALGYEAAIAALPHIGDIVARHCGLTPAVIPPFIAPYFFTDEARLDEARQRRILLVGKPEYRQAGYLDYDIARKILARHLEKRSQWSLVEVEGYEHREVAAMMRQAAILLNVNTLEGFNVTVPEAMAAGCLVYCYDAYGGRDFLRPGENAFVWPNNHIYPLLDSLCDLVDHFDERGEELIDVRRAAYATAQGFQESRTAAALRLFYEPLLRS